LVRHNVEMTSATPTNLKKPRRRWFLRTLLASLAGLLAWWVTDYSLSPQPSWSMTLEGEGIFPRGANSDNEWLFWHLPVGGLNPQGVYPPQSIVDMKTGKIKRRLPGFREPQIEDERQREFSTQPYLFGKGVWHLDLAVEQEQLVATLKVTAYERSETEQDVQTWRFPKDHPIRFYWGPARSGLLLMTTVVPSELFFIASAAQSWPSFPTNILIHPHLRPEQGDFNHANPVWCQTWQLPEKPGEEVRPLAGWALPSFRWQNWPPAFSPDGNHVGFDEGLLCFKRFVDPDWVSPPVVRGILVYDTRTGVLKHHLEPKQFSVNDITWKGPYLFGSLTDQKGNSGEPPPGLSNPLFDGFTGEPLKWPKEFPQGIRHVEWVDIGRSPPWRVLVHDNREPPNPEVPMMEARVAVLDRVGDQLVLQRTLRIADAMSLNWLGQDDLLLVNHVKDSLPSFLTDLCRKYEWLDSWARRLWPANVFTTTIYDLEGQPRWQKHNAGAIANIHWSMNLGMDGNYGANPDPSRLVTMTPRPDGTATMECYLLPMTFHSAWWSRLAGICVVVLFFIGRSVADRRGMVKLA
jgi:hypothetical protein